MAQIPSNFSLKEILESLPPSSIRNLLQNKFEEMEAEVLNTEELQTSVYKKLELVEEQCYFGQELLDEIVTACHGLGSKKELVKQILKAIDGSSFEL